MVLVIIKTILFLLTLFAVGFSVSVVIFKSHFLSRIVPVSLALGVIFYIFFLNITSYFIPLKNNFLVSLAVLLFLSFLLIVFKRKEIKIETKVENKKWFKILGVFLFLSFFIVNFTFLALNSNFDHSWHWAVTGRLSAGDFPTQEPFWPNSSTKITYHYSLDLLAASFTNLTGMIPPAALTFSTIFISSVFLGLFIIFLMSFLRGNVWWAMLLSFLFYFFGGLKYITFPFAPFLPFQYEWQIPIIKNWVWFIYGNVFNPFFKLASEGTGGLVYLCFLLIIFVHTLPIKLYFKLFFSLIFFSVLALSSETLFVVLFFSYCLVMFFIALRHKNYPEIALLTVFLIVTATVVSFQGGIISNQVRGLFNFSSTQPKPIGFVLRSIPAVPLMCDVYCPPLSLANTDGWKFIIIEYGLIIFYIPLIFLVVWRKRNSLLSILLITGILSILTPIFVSYPINEPDLSRISSQGLTLLYLLFIFCLYYLFKEFKLKKIFKLALMISVIFMVTQGITLNFYFIQNPLRHPEFNGFSQWKKADNGEYFDNLDYLMFKKFFGKGDWAQKTIYDSSPERSIAVFGSFSPNVFHAAFTSLHNASQVDIFFKNLEKLKNNLNLENLSNLGVDYIYLTPRLQSTLKKTEIDLFNNSNNLVLIEELKEGNNFRKLYQLKY
ncbi:MAG: hypothetical protein UT86_C0001G0034 [Candidatus Magasanikbacteria bacterium GW2011_GWC2_40_17]|uniref:YYY membrane protein n=1 Tax=Candidatus Magasanikbacteria bacterium GW2011_GWA2_42_32 TaxID=1619039 RepID=A0A0G1A8Y6_9BACT|nr:MAG: hypothetical protein UT86_C0001G0034 [Candidatus Magasanikbacteria bacterium GW2011_GWC2_40_17]KKS57394.1 MAG: hypothetical protein UV20_C0001G0034 [Candidatus Magasanikbacteria bacterium GW2011_GWA2_42_32]